MLEVEAGYYLVNKQFHDLLRSTARANDEKSRANFLPLNFLLPFSRGFLLKKLLLPDKYTHTYHCFSNRTIPSLQPEKRHRHPDNYP